MQPTMRYTLALASVCLMFTACGDSTSGTGGAGFTQPANTVAVNFKVDDSANQVFKAGELVWKGSFHLNSADGGTWDRKVTLDTSWSGGNGPYPELFDDGPWNAGGHEPAGSTAGDHKWGVTVFANIPSVVKDDYEYGLIDIAPGGVKVAQKDGAWIWPGTNGKFSVLTTSTGDINPAGYTISPFGQVDLRLTLDTSQLLRDGGTSGPLLWDTSTVKVKGGAWAWSSVALTSTGGTTYSFTLHPLVGAGTTLPHSGLLKTGDQPEFVFELGGVEYKDNAKVCPANGVSAFLIYPDGGVVPTPVGHAATTTYGTNTNITVP